MKAISKHGKMSRFSFISATLLNFDVNCDKDRQDHEGTIAVLKRQQLRRLWVHLRGPHVLRQWGDVLVVVFHPLWALHISTTPISV